MARQKTKQTTKRDERTGGRWTKLSRQTRNRWKNLGWPCALCGQPINWKARKPYEEDAPAVDHIKSWAHHPTLRYDPANLQVVHNACNRAKGAKQAALPSIGNTSRKWGKPRQTSTP